MRWLGRVFIILLEITGAALAGFAVLAGLLAWRLNDSDLQMSALEPYLLKSLNQLASPYQITIRKASLSWAIERTTIGLSAQQIQVLSPGGMPVATIPEIEVGISIPALLLGRVAPSTIRLTGPQLYAYRLNDGDVRFSLIDGGRPSAPTNKNSDDLLVRWMEALTSPPEASSQLGALRRIYIRSAQLGIDDYQLGVHWRVPRADLIFSRDRDGMRGRVQAELAVGQARTSIEGSLLYTARNERMRFALNLGSFNPADLVGQAPVFAGLAQVNLPFMGELQGSWLRGYGLVDTSFNLQAGAGQFQLTPDAEPLPVQAAGLKGRFDRQQHTADISKFFIQFDGPRLGGALSMKREGAEINLSAEVKASNMQAAELSRYWPAFAAKGARKWVTHNITAGVVPEAVARVEMALPIENPLHPQVRSVSGSMEVEGATVHYFGQLPAVTEAKGTARFTRDEFIVDVTDGRAGDLRIPTAKVQLLGLADDTDRADIALTVNGSLREQMLLLDHEPLKYMQRLGIDADKASGRATTKAQFQFPLFGDLPIEMVAIAAGARVENVGLPRLVAGQDLSNGTLDLVLDGGGMHISGTGQLGPAPAVFEWSESFVHDVSPSSEITFSGRMDEAARQAFKLAWPEVVGGVAEVKGRYAKDRGQPARIDAQVDLTTARLSLPWFAWVKPEGTAGTANVSVLIDKKEVVSVPEFSVTSGGARVAGSVGFAGDSQWNNVSLSRLSVPGTNLKGTVGRTPGQPGFVFNFAGSSADIRGIYEEDATAAKPAAAGEAAAKPRELLPVDVTFDIKKVVTGDGRELNNALGRVVRNARGWTRLRLDGTLASGAAAMIRLEPNTQGGKTLDMSTSDAGALFSTLRLMENISGGELNVHGTGPLDGAVNATADLRDFRYLNAKTLQRIAEQADPKGAAALAQSEGIRFSRMKAQFDYTEDAIRVKESRMASDLLGLTLQGDVDLLGGQLDLKGTLVPLYGVNSVVSGIPVIGWLLTGGEGGGVFAATYTVRGPLKSPETSVNPLAMLAPGFLRNILFMGGD